MLGFLYADEIPMTAYQMFFYFLFYAFVGWSVEVCYMANELDHFENRGFLLGPINPIYGFGVLIIIRFLAPIRSTLILYAAACIICTVFEFLVGLGLEKAFNHRWWSYDHERFNYRGIICLKVSMLWGLGCVFLLKLVQPLLTRFLDMMPKWLGVSLIVFFSVFIFMDTLTSLMRSLHLKFRIKWMDRFTKAVLLKISTFTGRRLASGTLFVKHRVLKDYSKQEVVHTGTNAD